MGIEDPFLPVKQSKQSKSNLQSSHRRFSHPRWNNPEVVLSNFGGKRRNYEHSDSRFCPYVTDISSILLNLSFSVKSSFSVVTDTYALFHLQQWSLLDFKLKFATFPGLRWNILYFLLGPI